MAWGKQILFLFTVTLAQAQGGMCSFDASNNPSLPTATCAFPSCPSGSDCLPPVIEKTTAQLDYFEPLIQWKETCPDQNIQSSCWEVHMEFHVKVQATDNSGVSMVGVNLAQEAANRRNFKKYWAPATNRDAQNRYDLNGTVVAYVPPGQQLLLQVYELCAKDALNNEGCVFPLGSKS